MVLGHLFHHGQIDVQMAVLIASNHAACLQPPLTHWQQNKHNQQSK